MKSLVEELDAIAAIPISRYAERNSRLSELWDRFLNVSDAYRAESDESTATGPPGSASLAASHVLRTLAESPALAVLLRERIRNVVVHASPATTLPVEIVNDTLHFYQNRIDWSREANEIVTAAIAEPLGASESQPPPDIHEMIDNLRLARDTWRSTSKSIEKTSTSLDGLHKSLREFVTDIDAAGESNV